ncbi:hypothetical protein Tco_0897287 [Tanacetum coccineum]
MSSSRIGNQTFNTFMYFGSLCYPTNDRDDLGKMKPKANTPSKADLDELFGSLYDEYYAGRNKEVSTNSVALDLSNNEDTPSSSTIIVDDNEAPPIVSTSEEPTSPAINDIVDESIPEDSVNLDGNTLINPFCSPVTEEAESSSTNQDPSNMHKFHQLHPSIDK